MASQYAIEASPLDQVAYGTHPIPSRHALLDRAVTLTRRTTVQPRRPTVEGQETNHRIDPEQGYGHALDNRDDLQQISAAAGSASQPDPHSRQRVLELRAARLSQIQPPSLREEEKNTTFNHQRRSTPLISNAFRDSVASDISFNSISGADERLSMIGDSPYQIQEDWPENPDRIAEAVRSLSLRRRQSIDTVRSSEFGEGGRWDRAWGGSEPDEDEDEDDRDDRDGTGAFQRYASTVVDIDGNTGNAWGPLNHIVQGQWPAQSNNLQIQAASSSRQLPPLQNASGVEHVVSLMPTAPPYRRILHSERGEPSSGQLLAQQNGLQRRDTVKSMMGDMGRVSPTLSRHRYDNSSATIGQTVDDDDRSTISNASTSNAHVCVWPPTPAASEHGDSNDGQSYNSRDTLRAYTNGPAMAQRVRVEYAPPEIKEQEHRSPVMATPAQPLSPSAALALPLTSPILEPDGTTTEKTAGSWSRHPAGKPPPQPPYSQGSGPHLERYSDPNKALPSSTFGELGRARRKAIEEHDGRESLVSDLDVETLRLDGSSGSGGSEDWDSRRGSTSTIGSFSSERIREQRQRRSLANSDMTSSEKRSSAGTIREAPQVQDFSRDPSHRSWNGESAASTGKMSNPSRSRVIGPPRRSNTGPDSYQAKPRENGYAAQAPSSNLSPRPPPATQGQSWSTPRTDAPPSSVTFSTPKPDRASSKGGSVIVKGATTNSQAEQFLTLAISHHESGDLSRSAYYFERSAKVEGGCIVGMCMWGMALREGWGVRKDQKKGFDWISRAAAKAGDMMSGKQGTAAKSDAELKATRSELKLSVYELGKCFCYGWGVKMDKPMALEYFELAAKLGDSDAQAEAGALLAAGKGCKKDLKKAAMYYRMAEAQGYDTVGLSWIHKDKYDPIASK